METGRVSTLESIADGVGMDKGSPRFTGITCSMEMQPLFLHDFTAHTIYNRGQRDTHTLLVRA